MKLPAEVMHVIQKGQRLLDRFTLIDTLGHGGMGEVWLAHDSLLDERIALKFVKPELTASTDLVDLLRRECRNARKLSHPNIVRVFDFHSAAPLHFISMEYVEGGDIGQFTGQHYTTFLPTLLPIIDALGYAHRQGLVHLDLKITNVLVDRSQQARLTDFGIAAVMYSDTAYSSGGTPYTMSPQLMRQQAPAPADDIYALGVLLYELITGFPPFYPQISAARVLEETPPAMECSPPLPTDLQNLVKSMLAKSAEARPSSMDEIAVTLRNLTPSQRADTIPPRIDASPSRLPPTPIAPLSLESASNSKTYAKQGTPGKGIRTIALGGFAALLAITAAVLYYLPLRVQEVRLQSVNAQRSEAYSLPPPSVGQADNGRAQEPWEETRLARFKQEADALALSLLEKQMQLQSMNVQQWSEEAYDIAIRQIHKADQLFGEGKVEEAIGVYTKVDDMLDKLLNRSGSVLQDALEQGRQALADLESARAIEEYETALAVDPTHKEAIAGLQRARKLPQALALMESGIGNEQQGNLELSRRDYRKAAELDPKLETAQTALTRIEKEIKTSQFKMHMTDGLSALDKEDFNAARQAFDKARALDPSSQAPLEGLSRLTLSLHRKQIDKHQRAAVSQEAKERWREAETHYQAALAMDPTLVFAKLGKERSTRRAKLSESLDFHIQNPERLTTESVLTEAMNLLDQASAVEKPGPRLKTQIARLNEVIDLVTTPVRVRLKSDNKTRVVVYRVGKLGTFETKELNLRPGRYTLVGTRAGFRDVRRQLNVVAGQSPDPILVRCEEKI